jgi:hypothetical protein
MMAMVLSCFGLTFLMYPSSFYVLNVLLRANSGHRGLESCH